MSQNTKYIILCNPGHNALYFSESDKLSAAELGVYLKSRGIAAEIERVKLGQALGFSFSLAGTALSSEDAAGLYDLSFCYTLFTADGPEGYLRPLAYMGQRPFDDSLRTMLKYPGKTNADFTRMMLNTAINLGGFQPKPGERLRVLDPLCGKGTSLFEALCLGHDAFGVELDAKAVHETAVFFKRYLETGRYKHSHDERRVSGDNKSWTAKMDSFSFARDKNEYRVNPQNLVLLSGDSRYCSKYFARGNFDVLLADLPYGVLHHSKSGDPKARRNPAELLSACLPEWKKVLRHGGIMALSWNSFLIKRRDLADTIRREGFAIVDDGLDSLEHRVDQAIKRDLIFASIKNK